MRDAFVLICYSAGHIGRSVPHVAICVSMIAKILQFSGITPVKDRTPCPRRHGGRQRNRLFEQFGFENP